MILYIAHKAQEVVRLKGRRKRDGLALASEVGHYFQSPPPDGLGGVHVQEAREAHQTSTLSSTAHINHGSIRATA